MTKGYTHKKGSALLVALLVMGILLTLTLGLSALVISEIRQTSDVVESGKAYFAAEAGIEQSLLEMSQGLPGYETEGWQDVKDDEIHYRYQINNKGDSVPYFPEDEPIFLTPELGAFTRNAVYQQQPSQTYNVLPLNETVTIPLFTDNGDGTVTDVTDFMVQYYVDFELAEDLPSFLSLGGGGGPVDLQEFDILRWKLFGNPQTNDQRTEAISDFYPAHNNDSAINPVCIGSASAIALQQSQTYNYDCLFPVAQNYNVDPTTWDPTGSVSDDISQGVVWSEARECYRSEAGDLASGSQNIKRGCSIGAFMEDHTRNYITLTNVVNPDIVGISNVDDRVRAARANIYYRVVALQGENEPKLVRDAAAIRADGYARNDQVRQSIDVQLHLSSFLPVFNFSLYRTDTLDPLHSPTSGGAQAQFPFL